MGGWRRVAGGSLKDTEDTMKPLTRAELQHIDNLLLEKSYNGLYYGPKTQYWARHNRIVEWVTAEKANAALASRGDRPETVGLGGSLSGSRVALSQPGGKR